MERKQAKRWVRIQHNCKKLEVWKNMKAPQYRQIYDSILMLKQSIIDCIIACQGWQNSLILPWGRKWTGGGSSMPVVPWSCYILFEPITHPPNRLHIPLCLFQIEFIRGEEREGVELWKSRKWEDPISLMKDKALQAHTRHRADKCHLMPGTPLRGETAGQNSDCQWQGIGITAVM